MRVQMETNYAGPSGAGPAGDIREVSEEEGKVLIASGSAVGLRADGSRIERADKSAPETATSRRVDPPSKSDPKKDKAKDEESKKDDPKKDDPKKDDPKKDDPKKDDPEKVDPKKDDPKKDDPKKDDPEKVDPKKDDGK